MTKEKIFDHLKFENYAIKAEKLGRYPIANVYRASLDLLTGKTKLEAVQIIQELSGGHVSAELDDAGEVAGTVWSLQTACHEISTWNEIFSTVVHLLQRPTRN